MYAKIYTHAIYTRMQAHVSACMVITSIDRCIHKTPIFCKTGPIDMKLEYVAMNTWWHANVHEDNRLRVRDELMRDHGSSIKKLPSRQE